MVSGQPTPPAEGFAFAGAAPAVAAIHLDSEGNAELRGVRCSDCGQTYAEPRSVCAKCCARDRMTPVGLAHEGELVTYTIVERSYPGVPTPFVHAVVALDGGGVIGGVFADGVSRPVLDRNPCRIRVGFRDTGQRDPEGRPFVAHYFEPVEG